jgi:transcriptional regulator with XRE-family HTH domain
MDSTFGTRLRQRREEQQVSLSAIAEQTKIKLSLLEGLERDDLSRWPTGIFRRSYFRAYARAIGLEPDRVFDEFQALYPDPDAQEDVTRVLAETRHLNGHSRPPTRLRCLIDSAVNALPALHLESSLKPDSTIERPLRPRPTSSPVADETLPLPLPDPPSVSRVSSASETRETTGVDFSKVALLCTRLARAIDVREVTPVLEDAAVVLHALGLTLWVRDHVSTELTPVFAHGYSTELTARLGRVSSAADNAIARAFRTSEARVVDGSDVTTGAVVVPLLTSGGCAGVLALELQHGGERLECVRIAATILAAQLSTLIAVPVLAEEAVGA